MSAVEICCTAADRARLDWLAFALAERGWACGWTVDRAPHADTRCAIVVWSTATRDAPWLRGVARGAQRRGILVSATLDGTEPPRGLRSSPRADLSEWPAKTADRAIDELLDDVASVIANPKPLRGRETDGKDMAAVAVVTALFVGLVYWLVTGQHRGGSATLDTASPVEYTSPDPARAQDQAPPPDDEPPVVASTSSEHSSAAAGAAAMLGQRAIDELARALTGDAGMAAQAQTSAFAALRVDPTEPNARFVYALCRALLDGEWQQGARMIGEIDEALLSGAAVEFAARWHLLHGQVPEAARLVTPGVGDGRNVEVGYVIGRLTQIARADGAPGEESAVSEAPLCALLDDPGFARASDAYRALTPPERLALLSQPCFLTRAATSRALRTSLGIGG